MEQQNSSGELRPWNWVDAAVGSTGGTTSSRKEVPFGKALKGRLLETRSSKKHKCSAEGGSSALLLREAVKGLPQEGVGKTMEGV